MLCCMYLTILVEWSVKLSNPARSSDSTSCMPSAKGLSTTTTSALKFPIKKDTVFPWKPSEGLPISPTRA